MSSTETEVKVDNLLKRSVNKTTFTKENYKSRVFVLDTNFLRYHDGKLQVSNMHFTIFTILFG